MGTIYKQNQANKQHIIIVYSEHTNATNKKQHTHTHTNKQTNIN